MSCPSRRPDRPPTNGQIDQMSRLLAAGAVSKETAKGPFDLGMSRCNPNIIGALRDKGMADSRVVRPKGGSQFTAYWLTGEGLKTAEVYSLVGGV